MRKNLVLSKHSIITLILQRNLVLFGPLVSEFGGSLKPYQNKRVGTCVADHDRLFPAPTALFPFSLCTLCNQYGAVAEGLVAAVGEWRSVWLKQEQLYELPLLSQETWTAEILLVVCWLQLQSTS